MTGGRVSSLPPSLESGFGEDGMAEEGDSREGHLRWGQQKREEDSQDSMSGHHDQAQERSPSWGERELCLSNVPSHLQTVFFGGEEVGGRYG